MSCYVPNISVSGLAVFNNNSENHGIIKNGLFKDNSENYGLITSTAYFSESSLNMQCGIVNVSAVFSDYSANMGQINLGIFLENSTNTGYVTTGVFDENIPESNRGTYLNFLPFISFKEYRDDDNVVYKYQNYFGENVSYNGNDSTLIYKNTSGDLYTGFYSSNYYLSGVILTNTEAPVILSSSNSVIAFDESNVILSVSARGTGELYYQWFKDVTFLDGSTSRNLEFKAYYDGLVGGEYSTTYKVIVANDIGSVTSPKISLVVKPNPPQIVSQTNSFSALDGSVIALSAEISGTQPLNLQWYKNNEELTGEINDSYIINGLNYWNLNTNNSGYTLNRPSYLLKVTNMVGEVYSERINVYPLQNPPGISSLNYPSSAEDGDLATISLGVSGTPSFIFTLYTSAATYNIDTQEYETILTEISSSLIEPRFQNPIIYHIPIRYNLVNSTTSSNVSGFIVSISNDTGVVSSSNILISALYKPVSSIIGPLDVTIFSGGIPTSQRRLTTIGTVTSVQWYYNGIQVSDQDLPIYDRIFTYANNGDKFYAIANGLTNSLTSREATINVTPVAKPTISTQPTSVSAIDGQLVTYSVTADPLYSNGGDLVNYQWYVKTENVLNGFTLIPSATSRDYSFYPTYFNNNYQYRVRLSNPRGFVESSNVSLTVSAISAVITQQPVSASISDGQTYSFSTSAVGLMPINYTWYKNSLEVQSSTSNSLTGTGYLIDNNSTFYVSVSNVSGIAISNNVILKVT